MFHDVLPSDSVSKVTNLSPHCLHVSKPHVDSNCEKYITHTAVQITYMAWFTNSSFVVTD